MKVLRVDEAGWEDREQGYRRNVLYSFPGTTIQLVEVPAGSRMPPHFHPGGTETLHILEGFGEFKPNSMAADRRDIGAGMTVTIPRGQIHDISPKDGGMTYLAEIVGDLGIDKKHPTRWPTSDDPHWSYAVYRFDDPLGQLMALRPLCNIKRWLNEGDKPDYEQYIERVGDESDHHRFIIVYQAGRMVGSVMVGTTAGYDREKTNAMLAHGEFDLELPENALWVNYPSFEIQPSHVAALDQRRLISVWGMVQLACKGEFPEAEALVARSRHGEIWRHVYTKPWECPCGPIDLRSFRWTAPDGKEFGGYDDRFSEYGILVMHI